MRLLLIGYYGRHNIGDDLMLMGLLDYLAGRPEVSTITVLCHDGYYPQKPKTTYCTQTSLVSAVGLLRLASADAVIMGGGTCFAEQQDLRHLRGMYRMVRICRWFGRPFVFAGIGIGDLQSPNVISLAAKTLNSAHFLYFRDESSLQCCHAMGVQQQFARVAGDLALLCTDHIAPVPRTTRQGTLRACSFSGLAGMPEELVERYAVILQGLMDQLGFHLHLLPAHGGPEGDLAVHARLARGLRPGSYTLHEMEPFEGFLQLLGQMDFHIGLRLHSLVLADLIGVPSIGVRLSPKIAYYLEKSAMLPALRLREPGEEITAGQVVDVCTRYSRPEQFISRENRRTRLLLESILVNLQAGKP